MKSLLIVTVLFFGANSYAETFVCMAECVVGNIHHPVMAVSQEIEGSSKSTVLQSFSEQVEAARIGFISGNAKCFAKSEVPEGADLHKAVLSMIERGGAESKSFYFNQ